MLYYIIQNDNKIREKTQSINQNHIPLKLLILLETVNKCIRAINIHNIAVNNGRW